MIILIRLLFFLLFFSCKYLFVPFLQITKDIQKSPSAITYQNLYNFGFLTFSLPNGRRADSCGVTNCYHSDSTSTTLRLRSCGLDTSSFTTAARLSANCYGGWSPFPQENVMSLQIKSLSFGTFLPYARDPVPNYNKHAVPPVTKDKPKRDSKSYKSLIHRCYRQVMSNRHPGPTKDGKEKKTFTQRLAFQSHLWFGDFFGTSLSFGGTVVIESYSQW